MSIIPKQYLTGYWPLDGHVFDMKMSGTANNGTATGAIPVPSQNPAIPASLAYRFNGSSDYIGLASTPLLGTTDFTIGCRFKTSSATRQGIIPWGNTATRSGLILYIYTDFKLHFDMPASGGPSSANRVDDGRWHWCAVVGTASNNVVKLYMDGKLEGSTTLAGSWTLADNATNRAIGREQAAANYFNGQIQEVFAFNKALTSAELRVLYLGAQQINRTKSSILQAILQLSSTVIDTITMSETATHIRAMKNTITDTFSLSESTTAARAFISSVVDTITSSDVVTSFRYLKSTITDTFSLSETTSSIKALIASVVDTISLSEVTSAGRALFSTIVDTINTIELVGSSAYNEIKTKIVGLLSVKPFVLSIDQTASKIVAVNLGGGLQQIPHRIKSGVYTAEALGVLSGATVVHKLANGSYVSHIVGFPLYNFTIDESDLIFLDGGLSYSFNLEITEEQTGKIPRVISIKNNNPKNI